MTIKSQKNYNNDVDLLSLLISLWEEKFKILFFIILSFSITLIFLYLKPNKTFTASTIIRPITSLEINKYVAINSYFSNNQFNLGTSLVSDSPRKIIDVNHGSSDLFGKINPEDLFSLYIETIREGTFFEEAIKKFNLLEKENYPTDYEYQDAVVKLASSAQLIPSEKRYIINGEKHHEFYTLRFEYDNTKKWRAALEFISQKSNEHVKRIVKNKYNINLQILKQQKSFMLEDLNSQITSSILLYDKKINNQLAILAEHSAIARELGIKKNLVETEQLNHDQIYLRGYEALDKQIELINARTNKNRFIPNLVKLENHKRKIEKNMNIERLEKLLLETPLFKNNFKSVLIKVASTKYRPHSNLNLYYVLSIIFGAIVGIIYVYTSKALKNRKDNEVMVKD